MTVMHHVSSSISLESVSVLVCLVVSHRQINLTLSISIRFSISLVLTLYLRCENLRAVSIRSVMISSSAGVQILKLSWYIFTESPVRVVMR